MKTLTPRQTNLLNGLIKRNRWTDVRIARRFGISPATVQRIREKLGLLPVRRVTPWIRRRQIIRLIKEGRLHDTQIAQQTRVSKSTVGAIRKELGIRPIPPIIYRGHEFESNKKFAKLHDKYKKWPVQDIRKAINRIQTKIKQTHQAIHAIPPRNRRKNPTAHKLFTKLGELLPLREALLSLLPPEEQQQHLRQYWKSSDDGVQDLTQKIRKKKNRKKRKTGKTRNTK